jgi:peroxisomal coenzyme A diphosphatase NUDT7
MNIEEMIAGLGSRTPAILGSNKFINYSVLVPLIEKEDGVHVLFEVRSMEMRRQPGEICFPGGRVDRSDPDVKHTAIRETTEELGIPMDEIRGTVPLDYMVSPFGMIIYPFAGMLKPSQPFKVNPKEVGEVFTVPLSYLLKTKPEIYKMNFRLEPENGFPFDRIAGGENYNWQTRSMEECFYYFEDKVIWGLTARILQHFIEIVNELPEKK